MSGIMTLLRISQVVACRWMDIVRVIDDCLQLLGLNAPKNGQSK